MYYSNKTLFDVLYIYIYIERERERENSLHKAQLHVSAFYNGHLQVEIEKNLVSSYTRLTWAVYSVEVRGEVGTSPYTVSITSNKVVLD